MKTTPEQRECLIELLKGVNKLDNPLWLHHIEQIQWAFSDINEQAEEISRLNDELDYRESTIQELERIFQDSVKTNEQLCTDIGDRVRRIKELEARKEDYLRDWQTVMGVKEDALYSRINELEAKLATAKHDALIEVAEKWEGESGNMKKSFRKSGPVAELAKTFRFFAELLRTLAEQSGEPVEPEAKP